MLFMTSQILESLNQKIERIQYNAALAITGAIKETSQSKFKKKLGFESLKFRRWFQKLCTFYKIRTTGVPEYLFHCIPEANHKYILVHQIMLQYFTAELMYINIISIN